MSPSARSNTLGHSLSNHGVDREVNAMFDVGGETLALPLSEKMKYEQGDNGDSFGWVLFDHLLHLGGRA